MPHKGALAALMHYFLARKMIFPGGQQKEHDRNVGTSPLCSNDFTLIFEYQVSLGTFIAGIKLILNTAASEYGQRNRRNLMKQIALFTALLATLGPAILFAADENNRGLINDLLELFSHKEAILALIFSLLICLLLPLGIAFSRNRTHHF